MSENITCPNCQTAIEISEALSSQLKADLRRQFEQEKKAHADELAKREDSLEARERELVSSQKTLDQQVESRLAAERAVLLAQASAKAKDDVALELKDKSDELAGIKEKLQSAQASELELRKKARELDEQKRELELTVSRQLDEERAKIREVAKKEAEAERELKDAENEKMIRDLRRQLAEMQRKAEQGSQQLQGEVLELSLEDQLRQIFPFDEVTPVPKGIHGGDALQTVRDAAGTECGRILWESKRTKSWSDGWLPKLREDQRAAKAQVAILVSIELPADLSTFRHIDGVWVTSLACFIGVASALRAGLIEVAAAKRSMEGRNDKMEVLYSYLSGQEFRHRVEGIVESFVTLREDLEAEKRATQRAWAKREKQLDRAIAQTAGMYGDLSGIIGASLPQIEQLSPQLIAGTLDSDEVS